MKVIKEIKISYFRSFSQVIHIQNINDLNVFSGRNDSGKSNILKALNLFFTESKVDFYTTFDFNHDFSRHRAQESKIVHHKQLISISILFKKIGIKSKVLPDEFWVEKTWNKDGEFHDRKTKKKNGSILKYKRLGDTVETDTEVKSSTTNFLKKIHFLYIPAIKDSRFFDYLKQEYQQSLGTKISKLSTSLSSTETKTLSEWMKQLTAGDITDLLSQKIDSEAERMMKHFLGNANEISSSHFSIPELDFSKVLEVVTENDIPLASRGDGIQAKFIPQILNEITRNKKAEVVIWGFEEPENSYEYANAQLLANKFKDEYSANKQIFLTSHAFNFISLQGQNVSLYRVWRESFNQGTQVKYINDQNKLFGDNDSTLLKDELGIIQLNQELEQFFRMREEKKVQELNEYKKQTDVLKEALETLSKPLVVTEGKTDWMHLKKAKDSLEIDMQIDFLEYTDDMGSSKLSRMIEEYEKIEHQKKIIMIFDRDEPDYIKKYGKDEFNHHGNNVYSFCIPKVNEKLNNISIEYYYDEDALRTCDENGRRLFFGDDFYANGNSICGEFQTQIRSKAQKQCIVDEKVYKTIDLKHEKSVALSKKSFADNIYTDKDKFNEFNFTNFRLVFDVIEKIVAHADSSH